MTTYTYVFISGNIEMYDILNLFFALVMISVIRARLFNELTLFFVMCVYSQLLCLALAN